VSARSLIVCGALLLFATAGFGADTYHRTKDKKTFVWIHNFKLGDEATWSGDRDEDGYATGSGTLTWYKVDLVIVTGSNLPVKKEHAIHRYSGKMVRGKLQGPVNMDIGDRTFHAKFAEGIQVSDWVAGAAPVHKEPAKHAAEAAVAKAPTPTPTPAPEQRPSPEISERISPEAPTQNSDSLRSLTMPPATLQARGDGESSSRTVQPAPSAPPADAAGNDDAKTVAALDTQYQAAVKANDAETMDRILSDDFVLMTGKGRSATKADLIKQAREKQTAYEHQEEEEGTQKVRVWGNTAVVTARLWIKGTSHGKPIDYKLWFSDTYRKTPDGWRYVFGQASLPEPSSTEAK
jgi:ketosteroid isomerase-like protein